MERHEEFRACTRRSARARRFLPLLYLLAQIERDDPISFPVEGFDGGSVSMLGVRAG
jgi:aromatic ring-opening dioxygenase catalytic subunit (LigB family)